jgi:exopolysaccharide biosynthesis polyprenyl glycosylphosphotransferase
MLNKSILKRHAGHLQTLMVAADALLTAAVYAFLLVTPGMLQPAADVGGAQIVRLVAVGILVSLLWPVALHEFGLYESQRRRPLEEILGRLMLAAAVPAAFFVGAAWAMSLPVALTFPLYCSAVQTLTVVGLRLVIFLGLRGIRRQGRNTRNLLIVGSGPRAVRAHESVEHHPEWGLRVVGFIDDSDVPVDPKIPSKQIHKFINFPDLVRQTVIDEVVVACPRSMLEQILPVVGVCAQVGVPITLLSDLFGDILPPPRVTQFNSLTALNFAPVHHSRSKLAIKRLIDVVGAACALALAAPAIGVAALIIRRTSPGPAIFRNIRCGRNGRRFEMLKLRTMSVDAEKRREELAALNEMDGPVFKIHDDPRVTPVGRVLRRWSIDELPQLWNVLKGDMSLVGPRPPIPDEVDQYATPERRRLSMRPGITCLWQVNGRNAIGFADWVKLDVEYIDNWSLRLDLEILAKTLPAVLNKNGAS